MSEQIEGFVAYNGEVKSVRLAKTGNLISTQYGDMGMVVSPHNSPLPRIYDTPEEAQYSPEMQSFWKQRDERENRCDHRWVWASHEEQRCPSCGAIRFVPDYNNLHYADAHGDYINRTGEEVK
jgi:hypothetical protein